MSRPPVPASRTSCRLAIVTLLAAWSLAVPALSPVTPAFASPPPVTFATQTTAAVGNGPYSVVIGDLNRDGKPDMVTSNSNASTVSILLGNGNGTFQAQTTAAVGSSPYSMAIGDLNGDGKPDIVTANSASNNVSILLGNGDGTFQPQTTAAVGTNPTSVTIGDLNGDGKPDIVTSNYNANTVSILLGNGNGTFAAQTTVAVGAFPYSVAIGDLNGDGKPDIVTANVSPNTVSILLGNGNGTFQPQTTAAVGANPYSVAIGDLNGDGKPDIVTANATSNTVSILLGNGNGTFQPQITAAVGTNPFSVAIGDLNGDGKPDIVTANSVGTTLSILLGNGDGTFAAQTRATVGSGPASVAIGDLNGDGKPDILAANSNATTVSILLQTFAPTITSATSTTFTPGTAGSFTVTATGYPAPAFSETGALPAGVTLSSSGSLSGTPAVGTASSYPITITASNGISPDATQSFTLTVNLAPAITSATSTTFTVGTAGSFTVTATGYPSPAFSASGILPSGVTLSSSGSLSGTPTTSGTYRITITASNSAGPTSQVFTLTVNSPPAIVSAATPIIMTVGSPGSFTIWASGFPTPAISTSSSLPSGVTLTDNHNGSATLAGTPTSSGTFPLAITASNGVGSPATQSITLTVNPAGSITGAIAAAPNPTTNGTTILSWSTSDSSSAQIYVSVNGGADTLVGGGTPTSTSIPWITAGNTYLFKLYAGTSHSTLLATTTVTHTASTVTGTLTASPTSTTTGSTALTWTTNDASFAQIYVSGNGGSDVLVAAGTPNSLTIPWITNPNTYLFKLYAGSTHSTLLASVTVTSTAPTGTLSASPNPTTTGSTTLTWTTSDTSAAQIEVSVNGSANILVGGGTPSTTIIPWITVGNTYLFSLYGGPGYTTLLSSVTVTRPASSITSTLTASPNPTSTGSITLSWSTSEGSYDEIYVSMNGGPEVLVAGGAPNSITIPWITNPNTYVFKLYAATTHSTLLATVTVTHT